METKKLERIILIILALLNIFLLVVVLGDSASARRSRRETEASLTALLSENGIAVAPEAELVRDCPAQCTVTRDLDLEQRRVRGFLGSFNAADQGGSIWYYESPKGQIVMRGTGEMEMLLSGEGAQRGGDPERAAEKLFSGAGVELFPTGIGSGRDDRVLRCCGWNGFPVFNAVMTLDFSGNRLYMASGTMVFNRETASSPDAGMDSVSALVRFLELKNSQGIICSRLTGLTPGYDIDVTLSGESTLTPVWRVETDTGNFYVNAVTGRLETVI